MEQITTYLTGLVSKAFADCGYDGALGGVTVSNRPDLCQYQCNGAMRAAKLYQKAPIAVATEVAAILSQNPAFMRAEAVMPGFLNLSMTDAFLLQAVNELAQDAHLGVPQTGAGKTVVVDYGGANVAKPLHIGHLRSAIIGESIKRLARAMGYNALGDVHLGDWGLQMGLVIAELQLRNPHWRCFASDFDPARDTVPELQVELLSEVYPFASKKSKEDEDFKKLANEATLALQNKKPGYYALWQEMMRVSVLDMKQNYSKLNATFDLWLGESDADADIPALMEVLQGKGLLRESDGALVVDVEEERDKAPVPPVIVKKSDNASNYATTDLATIYRREADYTPAAIWYLTDKRQALHFEQLFRCARKAQLVPDETELVHLGFGTMNGSDGKPYKTRDGGVMQLGDFLQTAVDAAADKLNSSEYVSAEQKEDTALKLGIAAVKFGDMINHPTKDYIFDLDRFLAFEGKTGVYILYTITRINSILKKAEFALKDAQPAQTIYTDAERELFLAMLNSGELFTRALAEKAPNYICENAFNLASLFSRFYHDNHILNAEDAGQKQAWLALCVLVKRLLEMHMDVLGIPTVENM